MVLGVASCQASFPQPMQVYHNGYKMFRCFKVTWALACTVRLCLSIVLGKIEFYEDSDGIENYLPKLSSRELTCTSSGNMVYLHRIYDVCSSP